MRTGHARIRVHPSPFRSYFRVCLQQQLPLTKLCTTCTRCVRRYQANTHYYVYPNNDTIITKGQPTVTYRTTWHEIYPRLILPALPSPHPHCLFHTSSLSPQSCISYSLSSSHTHTHARTHTHTHTRTHTHTLCVHACISNCSSNNWRPLATFKGCGWNTTIYFPTKRRGQTLRNTGTLSLSTY